MRVRRTDERHRACALEREVLHVGPFAAEEPRVFLAQHAIAENAHDAEPNDPCETAACTLPPRRAAGQVRVLERRAERNRRERRADSLDRRVELVEHGGLNLRGQLGAVAAVRHGLVRDDQSVRLRDRLGDRLEVERDERTRIDHLDLDAFPRQLVGRRERLVDEPRQRDHGHVSPLSHDLRPAEGYALGIGRDLLATEVERLVLDIDHGVGIGDGRPEQAGGVGGGARHDHLQPWYVRQPCLEALGVLRGASLTRAALGAQDQRHRELAARHEVRLRRLVDELVERKREEVDEHDLDHRAQPRLRGADGDAGDRGLGDRRVADALWAELLHEAVRAAPRPAFRDVLPEHEHARVGAHRLGERVGDCLEVRRLRHVA